MVNNSAKINFALIVEKILSFKEYFFFIYSLLNGYNKMQIYGGHDYGTIRRKSCCDYRK